MTEDYGDSTTVRAGSRQQATSEGLTPPGLLLFSPTGTPPRMTFRVLAEGETDLGRAPECTIRLNDDQVSRRHARILRSADGVCLLEDLDSANGVFVDGVRARSVELHHGMLVRLGHTLTRFLWPGSASVDTPHKVRARGMVSGPSLDALHGLLDRGAGSDLSFLVTGETGTGKELVARRLHEAGPRSEGPFVPVNCSAIPSEMVESELFGHVKGAFTGATADSPGLIRQADKGTLFLDEIGELPLASQAKLLRVLQDRQVRPVGGTRALSVDVRVVSATNRDLAAMVQQQAFRPDLYARLAELVVELPPLRERLEDIPLLLRHFLAQHADEAAGQGAAAADALPDVPAELLEQLCLRPWPFNIRELQSAVRRALLLADGASELTKAHFAGAGLDLGGGSAAAPAPGAAPAAGAPLDSADPEAQELAEALRRHNGDTAVAASELGISRSQLYRRAQKYKIIAAHYKTR